MGRCGEHEHVMHIVSSVTGKVAVDKTPYDLMRTTFPAGTLTGAPKIRAMQIISEFEQTTRGPYGGLLQLQLQSRLLHHHPYRDAQGR